MNLSRFLKTLGPGILFASTAIGVSHLVQSTRAGALYGFGLLGIILLVNLLKYPFFEYGSRYANVKGESLLDGYYKLGRGYLWGFFVITLLSMFFVLAAVGAVTAGFMDNLFGISSYFENGSFYTTFVLFIICIIILYFGKYKVLDSLIKIIGSVLLVSTLTAFVLSLNRGSIVPNVDLYPAITWDKGTVFFLIALMGWMPTAVDMSTWNSLWTIQRIKQTGYKPSLKETLMDFNFGYIISALLSICFVSMGAFMVYGTGNVMPGNSAGFAAKVVSLYTETIGEWSYLIIAAAAFSIMFGTCIAVFDGYSRVIERTSELLFLSDREARKALDTSKYYKASLVIIGVGSFALIWYLLYYKKDGSGFKALIDLATSISFLIAPFIAGLNFYMVSNRSFPEKLRPRAWMKILSWIGIIFLFGFSLFYVWYLLPT